MVEKAHMLGKSFDSQLLSGVYKLIILNHMKGRRIYPYKIYKHLSEHKHPNMPKLTKSELYNIVAALEKEGFIKGKTIRNGAVVRKYYTLTKKGSIVVKNSRKIVKEAFEKIRQLIKDELNG